MVAIFNHRGSFDKLESFLNSMRGARFYNVVKPYAEMGMFALMAATPMESGLAAQSWDYEIEESQDRILIAWTNSNIENGFPVVIMLQYGYTTGTGGYVQGRDFINPAIQPIFDMIADGVWKVVTSA